MRLLFFLEFKLIKRVFYKRENNMARMFNTAINYKQATYPAIVTISSTGADKNFCRTGG
jgi:hypothetical protein